MEPTDRSVIGSWYAPRNAMAQQNDSLHRSLKEASWHKRFRLTDNGTMIEVYGFKFGVYAWIARFALYEKGVEYAWIEVNPFAPDVDPTYLAKSPLCRVPTLLDGDFALYKTGAPLLPEDLKDRTRVDPVISIVDSYTYWPLVRQAFSHDVMGPRVGR